MDMDNEFLEYKHPVEGGMSFSMVGNIIHFSCRWPFDLHTDDWIEITNDFNAFTYAREVSLLPKQGSVRIEGERSGQMELTILPDDKVMLDVVDCSRQRPPRLVYSLDLSPSDLLSDPGNSSCPRRLGPRSPGG